MSNLDKLLTPEQKALLFSQRLKEVEGIEGKFTLKHDARFCWDFRVRRRVNGHSGEVVPEVIVSVSLHERRLPEVFGDLARAIEEVRSGKVNQVNRGLGPFVA